jgi:hypothetical protein
MAVYDRRLWRPSGSGKRRCEIVGVRLDQAWHGDGDFAVALDQPFRVDDRDA